MNRRTFLQLSAAGTLASAGNLSWADYGDQFVDRNDNAVILLYLSGGPTTTELFNPIPNSPVEFRSVTGHVDTKGDYQLGGLFKELAKEANHLNIYRGFKHRDANHASATHWVMTGETGFANQGQKWPSYGSMITKHYDPTTSEGVPVYVKTRPIQHDKAAWLGVKFAGFDANKEGRQDLILSVSNEQFDRRLEFIKMVDKDHSAMDRSWTDLREQAILAIRGKAAESFAIETDSLYNEFKDNTLGTDCLTAIRLIERGSKFVTINFGGWDNHNNIKTALEGRQPILDKYFSLLIKTLREKGMNKNVMVVCTGEFGRTPRINNTGGRDHHPSCSPLAISCDGYEMGKCIGKTDKNNSVVEDNPCSPEDLRWTIAGHVGIKKNSMAQGNDGRPYHFFKEENKNILTEL